MYDLPKLDDCKAENRGREDEIVATCFQRDSAKDQAVVYTFIILTVGLLVYAGVRPYIEKKMDVSGSSHVMTTDLDGELLSANIRNSLLGQMAPATNRSQ